jgi:hypothetical protein
MSRRVITSRWASGKVAIVRWIRLCVSVARSCSSGPHACGADAQRSARLGSSVGSKNRSGSTAGGPPASARAQASENGRLRRSRCPRVRARLISIREIHVFNDERNSKRRSPFEDVQPRVLRHLLGYRWIAHVAERERTSVAWCCSTSHANARSSPFLSAATIRTSSESPGVMSGRMLRQPRSTGVTNATLSRLNRHCGHRS